MDNKQNAKIDAAADRCMEYADSEILPFTRLAEFIRTLQEDPTWEPTAIIEVQTRVIRELMGRRDRVRPR